MLGGVLVDVHANLGKHSRTTEWQAGDRAECDAYCQKAGQLLADFVGTNAYACGDSLTYTDFTLFEVLD